AMDDAAGTEVKYGLELETSKSTSGVLHEEAADVGSESNIDSIEAAPEADRHCRGLLSCFSKQDGIYPADSMFGWIPTLAAMVNFMFFFGASNSYGVFSTYYLN
ncbi:hypothetical protein GGI02_005600, partial [Coemansia sp. RSA 2322]